MPLFLKIAEPKALVPVSPRLILNRPELGETLTGCGVLIVPLAVYNTLPLVAASYKTKYMLCVVVARLLFIKSFPW